MKTYTYKIIFIFPTHSGNTVIFSDSFLMNHLKIIVWFNRRTRKKILKFFNPFFLSWYDVVWYNLMCSLYNKSWWCLIRLFCITSHEAWDKSVWRWQEREWAKGEGLYQIAFEVQTNLHVYKQFVWRPWNKISMSILFITKKMYFWVIFVLSLYEYLFSPL